jgi:hypothetical protein
MKSKPFSWLSLLSISFVMAIGCTQPLKFPGSIPVNEDSVRRHILPIAEAVEYTAHFRTVRDTFYKQHPPLGNAMNMGQAEAFNRDAIAILLNQKDASGNDAAGVRIYYGLDKNGLVKMILVPYDSRGNDIINKLVGEKAVSVPGLSSANAFGSDGQTIEVGQRCPTICSDGTSGLNGQ